MTRFMATSRPPFLEGVGVALVASVVGGALFAILAPVLGWGFPLRGLVAGLGLAYVLYLLNRSRARVGKVTVVLAWLVGAVALWLIHPPFLLYLAGHAGAIWLVRSLYFHGGIVAAVLDLALSGFAIVAAIWAMVETDSPFLAIWCFFLVQALFTAIPPTVGRPRNDPAAEAPFERAHRAGLKALRALATSKTGVLS